MLYIGFKYLRNSNPNVKEVIIIVPFIVTVILIYDGGDIAIYYIVS